MRNLKRALSLALAAVMVLGMMVIGAGAASTYEDFTDKDEIQNKEAVNTMVSLGVLAGKEDGSYFDPTGTVTRAEMAKIVAVSLNGGKDPVMGSDSKTTFKDTQGHWAELYIAYCVKQGIIAGRGNNTFGPDEPVTGSAAAKMFLCALGYRADLEGLTGTDWEINTNVLANQDAKLYEGLSSINASKGLSRDNTAQMLYNAVQAQEVRYDNLYGDHSDVIQTVKKGSMLTNRFGVIKVTGVVEANDAMAITGNPAKEGYTRFKSITVSDGGYTSAQVAAIGVTFKVATGNDMVGQEVVIYVKFNNTLSPNAANSTVMGNGIITNSNTVVETTDKLKDAQKVKDALKGSGLAVVAATQEVYFDQNGRSASAYADGIVTTAGLKQRFIDNDNDGKVNYIIQELPALAKVSAYNTNAKTITLSGGIGTQDFADVVGSDKLVKDDYALVISYDGDTYHTEKAVTVEGVVSAYNSGNSKITIDGTAYAQGLGANKSDITTATAFNLMVGDTYKLYLDTYGNVLAYELVDASVGNLAVVLNSGANQGTLGTYSGQVKLLLADGTKVTYDVDLETSAKKLGANTASGQVDTDSKKANYTAMALSTGLATANGSTSVTTTTKDGLRYEIVSYSVDEDSKLVTIGLPGKMNSTNYANVYDGTKVSFKSTNTSYGGAVADNNTVFFIGNDADGYSVITGVANLSNSSKDSIAITAANSTNLNGKFGTTVYYQTSGTGTKVAKAVFLPLNAAYTSTAKYVYITGDYSKISSDVYEYPVAFEDGTVGTLKAKDGGASSSDTLYAYTVNGSGYASFTTPADVHNGYVVTYASGTSVSLASGADETVTASGILKGGASVWNVEDTDNIYDEAKLNKNMSVSYVTDTDGYIKVAFVNDSNAVFTDVCNKTAQSLTLNGSSTAINGSVSVASGYDVTVTGAGSVTYSYKVGNDVYTKTSNTGTFTVPENVTEAYGVQITAAPGATGAVYKSLTLPTGVTATWTAGGSGSTAWTAQDTAISGTFLAPAGATVTLAGLPASGHYAVTANNATNYAPVATTTYTMTAYDTVIATGYFKATVTCSVSNVSVAITSGEYLPAAGGNVVVTLTDDASAIAGTETSVTASIASGATYGSGALSGVTDAGGTATFTVTSITGDYTIAISGLS